MRDAAPWVKRTTSCLPRARRAGCASSRGLPGEERKTPGNTRSLSSQNAGPRAGCPHAAHPAPFWRSSAHPLPRPPLQAGQGMETGGRSKFCFSGTGLHVSTPTSSDLGWGQWLHWSHVSRNAALLGLRGRTPSLRQGGHSTVLRCEGLTGSQSSAAWAATSPNRPTGLLGGCRWPVLSLLHTLLTSSEEGPGNG